MRAGLIPATKILDLKGRLRCRGCGRKGRAGRLDQVAGTGRVSRPIPTSLHRFPSSLATVRRGHSVGGADAKLNSRVLGVGWSAIAPFAPPRRDQIG
jgi:hypothetical protein